MLATYILSMEVTSGKCFHDPVTSGYLMLKILQYIILNICWNCTVSAKPKHTSGRAYLGLQQKDILFPFPISKSKLSASHSLQSLIHNTYIMEKEY